MAMPITKNTALAFIGLGGFVVFIGLVIFKEYFESRRYAATQGTVIEAKLLSGKSNEFKADVTYLE